MSARFAVRLTDWAHDEPALRVVRHAVFIVEQQVPESLEWDEVDPLCVHALAEIPEAAAIGCGRLLPDGHIGRMAVLREWRGHGVGDALLARLVELAREAGHARARLNAQTHALRFYARHGFAPVGAEFDEAGIPHRAMERSL
jgi:predicted GNAT family N-acyltransferase